MKFFENFKFSNLFSKKKIDENILDKFEELLIESDVGTQIAADLKERFKKEKIGKEIKDEKTYLKQDILVSSHLNEDISFENFKLFSNI